MTKRKFVLKLVWIYGSNTVFWLGYHWYTWPTFLYDMPGWWKLLALPAYVFGIYMLCVMHGRALPVWREYWDWQLEQAVDKELRRWREVFQQEQTGAVVIDVQVRSSQDTTQIGSVRALPSKRLRLRGLFSRGR